MTVPNDYVAKGIFNIFLNKTNGYKRKLVKASSGSATIFLGAIVTRVGETAGTPEVDLCDKGQAVYGVITGKAWAARDMSKDSDSPYADGTKLLLEFLEEGDQVWLTAKTNTAITEAKSVQVDGGFIITFAYTDAAANTDTLSSVIGNAAIGCSATVSQEKLCLIDITSKVGAV
ncbi:MAG TPA: hypothetical protein ENI23_15240 [bacterium]|nr:hypothetical protein [bacterium]